MNLDKYIIDDRIFSTKFKCDLNECKGACCTLEGTLGAPIKEQEITEIENILEIIKNYLPEKAKREINANGFYIKNGKKINLGTVNGNECVFCFFDGDVAKCAIEKAYYAGEVNFKKPESCALFPIRVSGKEDSILKYEYMFECQPALFKGMDEDLSIFEFLEEPLKKKYGEVFYNELKDKLTD